jgi:hypothetical protein
MGIALPPRLARDPSAQPPFRKFLLAFALNAGCVEAATISGKIIGNVLTGNPPLRDVWGYGDF